MRPKNRRKKVLIGRLQCRFVGFLLGYFLLLMFTLVAILVIPPVVRLSFYQDDFSMVSAAATQLLYLHSRLWPALGIVLILFMVHSVLFSHRIAGPLVRIRRLFKEIGAGDLGMQVRIRRRDFLHPEVEALNKMLRALEHKVGELAVCEQRASAALARLEAEAREPLPRAHQELCASLEALRESIGALHCTPTSGQGSEKGASGRSAGVVPAPSAESGEADPSREPVSVSDVRE